MSEIKKLMADTDRLQLIAKDILLEAKKNGAHQAEVNITANNGFTVSAREGDVETVEYHQDKIVEIMVFFGKRSGTASISDLRPEAIKAAVDAACHIAKFTDEDPASGLPDKDEMAFNYPTLELGYPWGISVERAIEMAVQCEKEALAYDKRIMSAEDVSLSTGEVVHLYANSHDFIGFFPYMRHELSCVLIGKKDDDMQRDYYYTIGSEPSQLKSVTEVARIAAERTVNRLGARRLSTRKAPVMFAAEEARPFINHFIAAISGGSLYRKSSFLVDHLGKTVFPSFMHLQEMPHLPLALGSSPFDGDGLPTRENVFVEEGVIKSYALGVYSARKLGMKSTGNSGGVRNLVVRSGDRDFKAMLKKMGTGLLVTELMGQGVNLITGDYSRGAGGYWVENGEIQYPVHEITIAGNLKDMFANIVEVGNDVDIRGNVRTGSILIEEMMIAGS